LPPLHSILIQSKLFSATSLMAQSVSIIHATSELTRKMNE